MLRFLTDEDFNGRIVRGLLLKNSDLDLRRVQDVDLSGANSSANSSSTPSRSDARLSADPRTRAGLSSPHFVPFQTDAHVRNGALLDIESWLVER